MTRMEKSLESTQEAFSTIRTGRATPGMLDRIQVCILCTSTPLCRSSTQCTVMQWGSVSLYGHGHAAVYCYNDPNAI